MALCVARFLSAVQSDSHGMPVSNVPGIDERAIGRWWSYSPSRARDLRRRPSVGIWDRSPTVTISGLADVVRDVLTDLAASGDPIPEPLSERTYSGRFLVRVPSEVHRPLAREAAEQHVSLNRLVSDRLVRT
jgi:HicB family